MRYSVSRGEETGDFLPGELATGKEQGPELTATGQRNRAPWAGHVELKGNTSESIGD